METKKNDRKIIIAITGASGSIYAKKLIETIGNISNKPDEVAIVFTSNAEDIWQHELGEKLKIVYPFKVYNNKNFNAPFASGSSSFDTMIICPSSMGMMGRIANGIADDLVTRAADVILKERRKLIIVPRETPYNLIHMNNMKLLTEAGAIILPATPSFYSKPTTIDEVVMTVIERIMDLANLGGDHFRWGE